MAADIKISQMTAATSLAGDEIVPIVQEGTNKNVTISKIKEGLATETKLEEKADKTAIADMLTKTEAGTTYATKTELGTKVDKDGSKVLSDENFTLALKTKLDGIEDNANNYVHPDTAGNKHIPSGGQAGQVLHWSADGAAEWGAQTNVATDAELGGFKLGFTQADKKYPVQLDSEKAYVEVPWTDTTYSAATTSNLGLVKQCALVADSVGGDESAKINAILAALKTAGIMADA